MIRRSMPAVLTVLTLVLAGAAFAVRPNSTEGDSLSRSVVTAPDTTAESLWDHLVAENYQRSWKLWPGKGRLYSGTEPHGMLLTTYVNEKAASALPKGKLADLPGGSIIVKENYMPDSTLAAVTVMVRMPGYNPEHQDWLFAKYGVDGTAEAFGRVPMCQACHSAAESGAYIYTPIPQ